MIEWAESTKSFRTFLQSIYSEKKITIDMSEVKRLLPKDHSMNQEKRIASFNLLVEKYEPVMHLWFVKKFSDLTRWFQTRLTFTRSVAVWSIVGYVIGLGDRHAENLLMKEDVGCRVHVDFNCMFDRAKGLPMPENVPFRLTQNMIDGMGILKTNGTTTTTGRRASW
jgi:phosphatidylinositol kinase/protein kinase (PI-3  family)